MAVCRAPLGYILDSSESLSFLSTDTCFMEINHEGRIARVSGNGLGKRDTISPELGVVVCPSVRIY